MFLGNINYISVIFLFIIQCFIVQKHILCYSDIIKQHTKIKTSRYTILHRTILKKSQSILKIPDIIKSSINFDNQPSKEYLVEFRGLNPSFRYDEFIDAYHTVLQSNHYKLKFEIDNDYYQSSVKLSSKQLYENLIFIEAIPDTLSDYPICAYVLLPNDQIAIEITKRCSMIRRVIEVWGDKPSIQETSNETIERFNSIIEPVLQQQHQTTSSIPIVTTSSLLDSIDSPNVDVSDNVSILKDISILAAIIQPPPTILPVKNNKNKNTWWVHFERYGKGGRSGLSVDEKRNLLLEFGPLFKLINSTVDYNKPDHNLIYFEDWNSYQTGFNALLAFARMNCNSSTLSNSEINNIKISYTLNYRPHSCVFGRILCTGPSIVGIFDLKLRPFIGTTSMNALCAHIAANAANVQVGQQVLDPFCGTGSLLLAAAYLGAYVVGSDIDLDSLGKVINTTNISNINNNNKLTDSNSADIVNNNSKGRSKNIRFLRKDGHDQANRNTRDNFIFYNLQDKLLDLIGIDAIEWLQHYNNSNNINRCNKNEDLCDDGIVNEELKLVKKYEKFDAIISDPPFGRREKAVQNELHQQQYSFNKQHNNSNNSSCMSDIYNQRDDFDLIDGLDSTSTSNQNNLRIQLSNEIMLDIDQSSMGDPLLIIEVLLRIAMHRLKVTGKLVFFLPTKALVSIDQVMMLLNLVINDVVQQLSSYSNKNTSIIFPNDNYNEHISSYRNISTVLVIERVIPEELSNSLWRWLCVTKLVEVKHM